MKLKELHEATSSNKYHKLFLDKCRAYVNERMSAGDFDVDDLQLKSLEGCPEKIVGQFICSENKLTTLEFGPKSVFKSYYCNNNELTSLEGSPTRLLDGNFSCAHNFLTTLKGGPKYVNSVFYCNNNRLTNFDGAPEEVGGSIMMQDNINLKSLEGIHLHIKSIGRVSGTLSRGIICFNRCPIESHVLGLLLIENLAHVQIDNKQVQNIINKHLAGDRDVFDCQNELMDAGLDEYAQL